MIIARSAWLAYILLFAIMGQWAVVIFHTPIFLLSLPVVWLGTKDDHYWSLDGWMCLLMMAALTVTLTTEWPDYYTPFGFDKLFHMAGGAWLAGFWAVSTRRHVKSTWLFYAGIVVFALAIGGAWEVFEWALSLLPEGLGTRSSGLTDSMIDIIADTLGAMLVAGILYYRRYF